ncbi:AB hydrolase superfamily protein [Escovopsis weberi]|uniref:AB hydrolase superfamily protein n=1 Tax=Escovopsis weberi TaxID=150374 RepID=A0A0M8N9A2_ESCWE|nr:AB hydrolase superfamily protein [Escovopsis weberi]
MADMGSRVELLMALLHQLPLLAQVVFRHMLGTSELSQYLDLRAHIVVTVLRSFLDSKKPRTVSQVQKLSMMSLDIRGRIWISLYASPVPPETSVRDALVELIDDMSREASDEECDGGAITGIPELAEVEAEWTGYRAGASPVQDPPPISEADKYREMMKECRDPTTVLYFHGGAYYLMDPATHRPTTKRLAKMLGSRCYSVRYRLAPKHPFPCALLDALVSYLTLLYPPPDAFHEAVKPEHIIISGDSAGGNLALALVQVLLQLRRRGRQILWHGAPRPIPLPAGVATISPWADLTLSAPAWEQDTGPHPFDYLPRPRPGGLNTLPPCAIWPTDPPRENFYTDDALLAHPLVSVIMSGSWAGAPPMYMCTGWEFLSWEDKALARKLAADGVRLVFEEYEAMPHCFALILTKTPSARHCFESWVGFMRAAVAGGAAAVEARARTVKARTREETEVSFEGLLDEGHDEVRQRVVAKARSLARQTDGRAGPGVPPENGRCCL